MRIVVIAPTSMPSRRANTIQTAKMAQAFARLGHEVLLIASPSHDFSPALDSFSTWGREKQTPSPVMRQGLAESQATSFAHHYGLTTPFQIAWLSSIPALKRYDFALRSILLAQRWQADLIYTRLPQAAALSSLLNFKTIFEIHDLPHGTAAKLLRLFLRGKGALRVVTITHALANALEKSFAEIAPSRKHPAPNALLLVAPDGVDLDRYTPLLNPREARQKLLIRGIQQPSQFIAGYTGHLYPGRGINLILQMAKELTAISFLLAGGEQTELVHLQKVIEEQSLSNVFLAGFVPNAELPLYQMACDVLLMPYQKEVAASSGGNIANYLSPMKLFEYLACGRPILASDLPVFHEIIDDRNAILLPPDDIQPWIKALLELHNDPVKREKFGQSARQTAQNFTWEERVKAILL